MATMSALKYVGLFPEINRSRLEYFQSSEYVCQFKEDFKLQIISEFPIIFNSLT